MTYSKTFKAKESGFEIKLIMLDRGAWYYKRNEEYRFILSNRTKTWIQKNHPENKWTLYLLRFENGKEVQRTIQVGRKTLFELLDCMVRIERLGCEKFI